MQRNTHDDELFNASMTCERRNHGAQIVPLSVPRVRNSQQKKKKKKYASIGSNIFNSNNSNGETCAGIIKWYHAFQAGSVSVAFLSGTVSAAFPTERERSSLLLFIFSLYLSLKKSWERKKSRGKENNKERVGI